MIPFTGEDIGHMIVSLAIYHIALTDLQFGPHETEDQEIRDKALVFVSEVLGPKIVAQVDQAEAALRAAVDKDKNHGN